MDNRILSQHDMEHIKTHKYATTGYSWLDNHMNGFWIKCSEMLPHWLSPNMVTVLGLLAQMIGIFVILFYDRRMIEPLPTWTYFFFVLLMFIGQTLDAIDGKHARNTNRSSPLGQLMDHGCDAFSNSFIVIMIVQAHTFGPSFYTILVQFLVQFSFFMFTLEERYTGKLRTHIDNIGVTEFQFIGMGIILIPVLLGPDFSKIKILSFLTIGELLVYLNGFYSVQTSIMIIRSNSSSVRNFAERFYPLLSMIILGIAEFMCMYLDSFFEYTIYFTIMNGMYFAFLSSKLIVGNMTKRKFELLDMDCFLYMCTITAAVLCKNSHVELGLIIFGGIWIAYRYFNYMFRIIFELLDYLKISF